MKFPPPAVPAHPYRKREESYALRPRAILIIFNSRDLKVRENMNVNNVCLRFEIGTSRLGRSVWTCKLNENPILYTPLHFSFIY